MTTDRSQDGKIAEQNPAAGQYVDKFSTVSVTTWAVTTTTVPNVVGQTVIQAGKLQGEVHLGYETLQARLRPTGKAVG